MQNIPVSHLYRPKSTINIPYQQPSNQHPQQQPYQSNIPEQINFQPPPLKHAYSQNYNQPIQINTKNIQNQNVEKKIDKFIYNTKDQIGLGFSSHVYKGKNEITNERVAIKVMNLKKIEDELSQKFVNDEIAILERIKNLRNDNLLKLQGVFKTYNNLYIISEFCEGKDMGKVLRQKKQLNQKEAQSVLKQILKGYAQIYKLGVVHRDLKLANIFIKQGTAKIADFGFAVSAEQCNQKLTYNVGSPYYMPPQSLKYNKYSFKSDVWSFGIIAYEMVHGYLPWKDKVESILYDKIASNNIASLINPSLKLSSAYVDFIIKCLTFDYDLRATPETIIFWPWDLASPMVQGIEQEPESPKQPPPSYVKSRRVMHGVSFDEEGNAIDLKDKKGIFESGKAHLFKKASLNGVTKLIQQKPEINNSPFSIDQKFFAEAQCCRFLFHLREEIKKNTSPPMFWINNSYQLPTQGFVSNLQCIKTTISFKRSNKLRNLVQCIKTNGNALEITGFQQYIKTPAWQKQKRILIQQFNIINQLANQPTCQTVIMSFEQLSKMCINMIKELKQTLNIDQKNLRWLELLTAYFHFLILQRDGKEQKIAKVDLKPGNTEKLKIKWNSLGI